LIPELACPSCGTAIRERFCPHCGEQRPLAHGLSCRHYLEELFDALTHLDSKLLRSMWLLVSRPGLLSVDYLRGRRVQLVSPLRLFVFVSIVYFISLTLLHTIPLAKAPNIQFNTFATPLSTQLHGNDFYGAYAARQVEQKMRRDQIGYQDLEHRYNEKTAVLSKTLVFALIPVIALLFGALFFRKRRFIAEHLVIATHFWAFTLVLIGVLLPAVLVPVIYLSAAIGLPTDRIINDVTVSYVLQLVFAAYLYLMLRRVYAASAWYSAAVALVIAWSFFFIVWLFRFFLFEVTLPAI
jgi:hypothetical protein